MLRGLFRHIGDIMITRKTIYSPVAIFAAILTISLNLTAIADETPNHISMLYPGVDGRMLYIPDDQGNTIPDFSHAGYMGGGKAIPFVPVSETLWPVAGDNSKQIQNAIDRVSDLPPDSDGFRGAVLLKHGEYELHEPLRIAASGVVLRGEGMDETSTVLIAKGVHEAHVVNKQPRCIIVGGKSCWQEVEKSRSEIVDEYVSVGACSFTVKNAGAFKPGDTVLVKRHGNQAWIDEVGMNLENENWRWEPFTISYDRVVTDVAGKKVTVDAPLVCAIEKRWGGGEIVKNSDPGRISQVGIENLRGVSDYNPAVRTRNHGNIDRHPYLGEEYYSDERHCWNFITVDNAKNVWVRNTAGKHFAGSLVLLEQGSKWVTVQDCRSFAPVSVRSGGRRFTYRMEGQLALIQRCRSDEGRHSFVLINHTAAGPNVYLNCSVTKPFSSSEPHHHYVTGALYDNVEAPLTSRFWKQIGIGWAGANCVFWNCEGPFLIQKPPTAQNYAFGQIGIHATVFNTYYQDLSKENGHIESWDRHVDPSSLYLSQLKERCGAEAVSNIGY